MEKTLKQRYEEIAEEYRKALIKQFYPDGEMLCDDSYWVGDEIGGVLEIGDYYISYDDVRYIIDNNIDFTTWDDWYDYTTRIGCIRSDIPVPNLKNWCAGCPRFDEEQIKEMEAAARRVEIATMEFEKTVERYAKGGF